MYDIDNKISLYYTESLGNGKPLRPVFEMTKIGIFSWVSVIALIVLMFVIFLEVVLT